MIIFKKPLFTTSLKAFLLVLVFNFLGLNDSFSQTNKKENFYSTLELKDAAITEFNTVTSIVYKKNKRHFVYTGGDGGLISGFEMDSKGKLTSIGSFQLNNIKDHARGFAAANIEGTDYLFVGNKAASAIEVYKINNDGSLKRVFYIEDTEETHLGTVITLEVVHMKKASYLFAGGLERKSPGLSSFKIKNNGELEHVKSLKDDDEMHTDGIIGMHSVKINSKTFLFTGGFQDNGISSFRVLENGTFKNINNVHDNTKDRYLTGAYPVDGVSLGGNHYVIVGHRHHKYYTYARGFIKKKDFIYHGDGVSVFKVTEKGELVPHYTLVDNEETKISGQTRIELFKVNKEEAVIAIATRDDKSIQLCKLDKNGILHPTGHLQTGYPVYYGMSSQMINDNLFLAVGSVNRSPTTGKFLGKESRIYTYKISKNPKVLRHIVNLKYKSNANDSEITNAVENFINLQYKIPEIIDFEWGLNNSKEGHSKDFTHCFTLTFKDEKARDVYLAHKDHLALVEKVGPLLEDVLVMDYWAK